jgi:hypothetical protein
MKTTKFILMTQQNNHDPKPWKNQLAGLFIGLFLGVGVTSIYCYTHNNNNHHVPTITYNIGPCEPASIANNNNGLAISDAQFGGYMSAFQNNPLYRVVTNGNQRLGLYGARIGTTALQNIICLANTSGDSAVYVRLGYEVNAANPNNSLTYFMFTGMAPANATRLYYRDNGSISMCPINCMIPQAVGSPRL